MNNINTSTSNNNFKEVKNMNNIDTQYQNYIRIIPDCSKYLKKGGNDMNQNYDAENGMYDQIEMQEMAYYGKLFDEGGNSMNNTLSTTRATGADFYSIFAGTGITRTYPEEFDVTVEDYGDGCDYNEELDDMYEQAEMAELSYYEKLFEEEGGE